MTPYSFGQKVAEDIANKLTAAVDPLGVGGDGPKNRYAAGATQILKAPAPLQDVYRENIAAPESRNLYAPRPLKSKKLLIVPNKPIQVIDPNKKTT